MPEEYPWYFPVNDRPVIDSHPGEFIRSLDMLNAHYEAGGDVDRLTKEQFDALLAQHRKRTAER
jgi:uncharacterized protein YqfA (UPF0365 family)